MDALKLLRELVEIDTTINPSEGKYPNPAALDLVREAASSLGLSCQVISQGGLRHLIARAGDAPVALFMAHLDTVPFDRGEWRHDPLKLTVEGGRAFGRGALDDKGNVAALLAAVEEAGVGEGIALAVTMDEEAGGGGARLVRDSMRGNPPRWLVNADGNGMVVINRRRGVFEATIRVPESKLIARGREERVEFRLDYKVRPAHHAAYFLAGVDSHPLITLSHHVRVNDLAVAELGGAWIKTNVVPARTWATVVARGEGTEVEVDPNLTGLVKAIVPLTRPVIRTKAPSEYGINATPNYYRRAGGGMHELVIDIRAMTDDEAEVRRAVEEQLGELRAEVEVSGGGGYLYTDPSSDLVAAAFNALRRLGVEPRTAEMNGASDSRHFASLGVQAIDFGPVGGNIHGPDEYVDLNSLELTVKFYAELMRSVMRSKARG
ncbi:peptidase [Thermocladium modestius]|uniref:Peptidase n=1 Tax=Thermocladium modestius TaxID=62609 RepID=A0A830GVR1_9CREN|nr:M20/M25/M40 family metallo-hydrolase [Thermocladium modestius]GGP20748.1 peptidase [Thermocladium modestius]